MTVLLTHRAELVQRERFGSIARSNLPEKHGSPHQDTYRHGNHREDRRKKKNPDPGNRDVDRSLDSAGQVETMPACLSASIIVRSPDYNVVLKFLHGVYVEKVAASSN